MIILSCLPSALETVKAPNWWSLSPFLWIQNKTIYIINRSLSWKNYLALFSAIIILLINILLLPNTSTGLSGDSASPNNPSKNIMNAMGDQEKVSEHWDKEN